jgi:hypothetical protein
MSALTIRYWPHAPIGAIRSAMAPLSPWSGLVFAVEARAVVRPSPAQCPRCRTRAGFAQPGKAVIAPEAATRLKALSQAAASPCPDPRSARRDADKQPCSTDAMTCPSRLLHAEHIASRCTTRAISKHWLLPSVFTCTHDSARPRPCSPSYTYCYPIIASSFFPCASFLPEYLPTVFFFLAAAPAQHRRS